MSTHDLHPTRSTDLPTPLQLAVDALGFRELTPIQTAVIGPIAEGADVVARAETGSGKTAAYALPLLVRLMSGPERGVPRVLVVSPTRELALQVARTFKGLAQFVKPELKVATIIGGESIDAQLRALDGGPDILSATPGRLLDLVARGGLVLSEVGALVLDEADKLLDAGFKAELDQLLEGLDPERQTLLFSATLPDRVRTLAAELTTDALDVDVEAEVPVTDRIVQHVFEVPANRRRELMQRQLQGLLAGQVLVFVATKRATWNLVAKLRKAGFSADALHGGLAQADRIEVLARFGGKAFRVLVCTDIAARGIDTPRLDAVVNFDLPRSPNDYLHRIGRTGRAGRPGLAVSYVDHDAMAHLALIANRCGLTLSPVPVEGFALSEVPARPAKGPPPTKGKRKSKKDKLREAAARAGSTL